MSTQTNAVALPTLEERLLNAAAEADQIVAGFSPAAAGLIAAGIQTEPIIHGLVAMIAALFKHHASQPVAPSVTAAPAPAPVAPATAA